MIVSALKYLSLLTCLISLSSSALDGWIEISNHKNVPILFKSYQGPTTDYTFYKFTECFQVPDQFAERVKIDEPQGTFTLNANSSVPLSVNPNCFDYKNKIFQFFICQGTSCAPTKPASSSFLAYEPTLPKVDQIHWYTVDKGTWIEVTKTLTNDYLHISVSSSGK